MCYTVEILEARTNVDTELNEKAIPIAVTGNKIFKIFLHSSLYIFGIT